LTGRAAAAADAVMIRNVIWDVDGTLFDTYPAISRAFGAALNELGADAPLGRIDGLARISLGECARVLAAEHGLDADRLGAAFARHYEQATPQEQPPFPGAREICDLVSRRGGRNVIVTHRGAAGTTALLAGSRLTERFAGWITRNDGYPRKPDPTAFVAIMARCDLVPAETLAVGDRDIDVLAGRAAGVRTCLVGHESGGVVADLTVADLHALYRHLLSARA
jgi:phosphoglycolate phosphatase-like HAD superfamily hydrolase